MDFDLVYLSPFAVAVGWCLKRLAGGEPLFRLNLMFVRVTGTGNSTHIHPSSDDKPEKSPRLPPDKN